MYTLHSGELKSDSRLFCNKIAKHLQGVLVHKTEFHFHMILFPSCNIALSYSFFVYWSYILLFPVIYLWVFFRMVKLKDQNGFCGNGYKRNDSTGEDKIGIDMQSVVSMEILESDNAFVEAQNEEVCMFDFANILLCYFIIQLS